MKEIYDTSNSVQVFKTAGRLLTGSGASNQLFSEMCRLNLRHPLIVTDKGVLDAGLIQPIVTELKSQGITGIVIYSEISAEPKPMSLSRAVTFSLMKAVMGLLELVAAVQWIPQKPLRYIKVRREL